MVLHIKLHSWPRFSSQQPSGLPDSLSHVDCSSFWRIIMEKRKLGWNKKEKAFRDLGINLQTRERRRHVRTYLICPNVSALWRDKFPRAVPDTW